MNTPIYDFVRHYADSNTLRLHMPGHKGIGTLGIEHLDITEICGADSLYEANGIIQESEQNASLLFGCPTFYSAEGSSLCIRAIVFLTTLYAKTNGRRPLIWAARNVHKTFLSAIALTDVDVLWLSDTDTSTYLSCRVDASELDASLTDAVEKPIAIYLTSPDYLGTTTDIETIAEICHRHGVLLAVDNAHGAYLRFLPTSRHPIDLGADLVCDSAHKTLPVLTGGAYLHINKQAPAMLVDNAKNALALFASTSPSYLILQSLDVANAYLADAYPARLSAFLPHVQAVRQALETHGYVLYGDEWLKLTICAKSYGYYGTTLAKLLRNCGIECEFADPDYTVLMLTPEIGVAGLQRLQTVLLSIPRHTPIEKRPPRRTPLGVRCPLREALLAPSRTLPAAHAIGHVLASANVSCPPAVPIAFPGEVLDENAIAAFEYYGIETCNVIQ